MASSDSSEDEGVHAGAILMLALGEECAAGVFKYLAPKEVQRLGETIAKLRERLGRPAAERIARADMQPNRDFAVIGNEVAGAFCFSGNDREIGRQAVRFDANRAQQPQPAQRLRFFLAPGEARGQSVLASRAESECLPRRERGEKAIAGLTGAMHLNREVETGPIRHNRLVR